MGYMYKEYNLENFAGTSETSEKREIDGLQLKGNLEMDGSVKAKSFYLSDGKKVSEVVKLGLPKNIYVNDKKIGINQKDPKKALDIIGGLNVKGRTNLIGQTNIQGKLCMKHSKTNKTVCIDPNFLKRVHSKIERVKRQLRRQTRVMRRQSNNMLRRGISQSRHQMIKHVNIHHRGKRHSRRHSRRRHSRRRSSRRRSTTISIGSNRNRTDRNWKRAQNRILKTRNFEIKSMIKLSPSVTKNRGWKNIYQIGNNARERSPAMWMFPSNPWKLHFRLSTNRSSNHGHDFTIPAKYRKWNRTINIKTRVMQRGRNLYILHYINNRYVSRGILRNTVVKPLYNRNFYVRSPWFKKHRAGYSVRGVVLTHRRRRRSTKISISSNRNRTDRGWKRAQNRILKTRKFTVESMVKLSPSVTRNKSWKNIYQIGNNAGERSPAMWFFPRNPWRLHFRLRTNRSSNSGHDFTIPAKYRKWNRNIKIKTRVIQSGRNLFIYHYINNRYVSRGILR